ncbi:MAG: LysR family transcriptional regulator [Pseudomonadota bacterium]
MTTTSKQPRFLDFQRKVTLRHLRLLHVLGRELNLSRCAELMHTSQPAVSRGLQEIEGIVGASLFDRTTRAVKPTALGLNLIWHADRILADMAQAESDFIALSQGGSGGLDVGVLHGMPPDLLSNAIQLLSQQAPQVEIRLHEGLAHELIRDLGDGVTDLMLGHLNVPEPPQDLNVDVLFTESVGILISSKHRFARRSSVSLQDLVGEHWVLPPLNTTIRLVFERAVMVQGHGVRPHVVEATDPHFVLSLVRESNRVAAVPLSLAQWFVRELGAVRLLTLTEELVHWPICIAHRKSRGLSPAASLFARCVKSLIEGRGKP